jgi:hypothetical protein
MSRIESRVARCYSIRYELSQSGCRAVGKRRRTARIACLTGLMWVRPAIGPAEPSILIALNRKYSFSFPAKPERTRTVEED